MLKEQLSGMWYDFIAGTCRLLSYAFFRLRVRGLENMPQTGPFVIACNHQSYLDPVFCSVCLPRRVTFLARDTLFTNWFFGRLIGSLSAIPVKRGQGDLGAMKEIISRLKQGRGVCLFPEGTRTSDGRIAEIKPGFGLLCRRGKATVVPTVVDGAFECWPRGRKMFKPGKVWLTYGPPIAPEHIKEMNNQQLADELTRRLRELQDQMRRQRGKPAIVYDQERIEQ